MTRPRPRGEGHTGRPWRRLRQEKLAPNPLPCYLCGRLIEKLPDGTFLFKYPHDWSPSVHAIIPVSRGGRLTSANTAPTHLGCNRDWGNKLPHETDSPLWIEGEAP